MKSSTLDQGESETQYVNRALRSIRRFALRYDVLAIVVVHPTSEVGKDGNSRVPTLYDCEACRVVQQADHGVVIDVPNPVQNETVVWVKEARFFVVGPEGRRRSNIFLKSKAIAAWAA